MNLSFCRAVLFSAFLYLLPNAFAVELTLTGDWQVRVDDTRPRFLRNPKVVSQTLDVAPSLKQTVKMERYDSLPVFQPAAPVWAGKGAVLQRLKTQETSSDGMLVENSLKLFSMQAGTPVELKPGVDYLTDLQWAVIGRTMNGGIAAGQPVYASYECYQSRLDAVVRTIDGKIVIRPGKPTNTLAQVPGLKKEDTLLATIWVPGRITKLTADNLFPILEMKYPEPRKLLPSRSETVLHKTMEKLRKGQPIRLLAWGDSVTDAGYLPHPETERWQAQFVERLRKKYPRAQIELISEGWGGRTTASFLAEPPGSPHNFREKVLGAKPDLIVSEFVNDAGIPVEQTREIYKNLLRDFQGIGAEWIILTPHYVRPDWMGLTRLREIDDDPRPYVKFLREFAAQNPVGLADASKRWGRLWRQGIPYTTLFMNSINHPDARGMKIFADSLMELF
jgi:lysophospholipase L1-like esterase